MATPTLNTLKKELLYKSEKELLEICLGLAKQSKINKEYLDFALFMADDNAKFLENISEKIKTELKDIDKHYYSNAYKILKKTLKMATTYAKFSGNHQNNLEILLCFTEILYFNENILDQHPPSFNLFKRQYIKINKLLEKLHPDLQYDYEERVSSLKLGHEQWL